MTYIKPEKDPGVFSSSHLNNGIPVFYRTYEQTFGLPKIAFCFVVNAGGRDDVTGKEGAAHFFEHMPFRGTKQYPNTKSLTQFIENSGGYINAFTTDEATAYEVIVPVPVIEEAMKRIADMVSYPLLREEDISTERSIIQEELRNKLANVNFYAKQHLYKGLLGNHPIVQAVIGTESSLRKIKKTDLTKFHNHYYNASNGVLFITGTFKSDKLLKLCQKYFGTITPGTKTIRDTSHTSSQPIRPNKILRPKNYNRSVYMLGRALPYTNPKQALDWQLFRGMLSWGLHSPLYDEIREKRGLAYDLGVYHNQYSDIGVLLFMVTTQFHQMEEVNTLIWQTIHSILTNQDRFDEVKQMLKQMVLYRDYSLETVLHEAVDDYLDYGEIISLNELITMLEKVTLESLSQFILPYLDPKAYLNIRVNCDQTIT